MVKKWSQAMTGMRKGEGRGNRHVEESGLLQPYNGKALQTWGVPGPWVTMGRLWTMRLMLARERYGPQDPRPTLQISGHLHGIFQARWQVPQSLSIPSIDQMRLTWQLNCAGAKSAKEQCGCDGWCQVQLCQDIPLQNWLSEANRKCPQGPQCLRPGKRSVRAIDPEPLRTPITGPMMVHGKPPVNLALRPPTSSSVNYRVASLKTSSRTSEKAPSGWGRQRKK